MRPLARSLVQTTTIQKVQSGGAWCLVRIYVGRWYNCPPPFRHDVATYSRTPVPCISQFTHPISTGPIAARSSRPWRRAGGWVASAPVHWRRLTELGLPMEGGACASMQGLAFTRKILYSRTSRAQRATPVEPSRGSSGGPQRSSLASSSFFSSSARAGSRRFWRLSALRAPTKAP